MQSEGHAHPSLQHTEPAVHFPVMQQSLPTHAHLHFMQSLGHLQASLQHSEPAVHLPVAQQPSPVHLQSQPEAQQPLVVLGASTIFLVLAFLVIDNLNLIYTGFPIKRDNTSFPHSFEQE